MLYLNELQKVDVRGPHIGAGHQSVRGNKVKNRYFPGDSCHSEQSEESGTEPWDGALDPSLRFQILHFASGSVQDDKRAAVQDDKKTDCKPYRFQSASYCRGLPCGKTYVVFVGLERLMSSLSD